MNIKREIQQALKEQNFTRVEACFQENESQTMRILQMHVYGLPHEQLRWTAIDHISRLAGLHAKNYDMLFRNIIRRFIWQMCEESANVPWASSEVIGSIIAKVPGKQFEEFIGPLFYHTDLNDICYAGLYWALPQLMIHHSEKVEEYLPNTYYWFDQFDLADLRAYAILYFRDFPHNEMCDHLEAWKNDERRVAIYLNGSVQDISVAELANAIDE